MKTLLTIIGLAAVTLTGANAQIAIWTFQTSMPTTGGPLSPEVGNGTATSNTGGTFTNPAGWGSTESWSSPNWNVGEYFQFQVNTTGFENIGVSWQQTGSNTGPANFVFQYSLMADAGYLDFANYSVTNDGWDTTVTPAASVKSFNLSSVTAINNAPNVYFRLTMLNDTSINGGTVGGTGTGRVDNFTVIPEPTTVALISLGTAFALLRIRRRSRA